MAPVPDSLQALAATLAATEGGRRVRQEARRWLLGGAQEEDAPDALRSTPPGLAAKYQDVLEALGWRWAPFWDASFPEALTSLDDPPVGVFLRGTLPGSPAVALVGSRRASAYGREVAEYLGGELSRAGVWVISGMARGVDAAAHRGALAAGGRTAAVWGSGPDRVYPKEHERLADEIAASGCLVTEYPPGSPPLAHHFPERNRLIAGLAQIVIVVEADERSGALITARLALDEGREVMAIPGSVFSRLSAGPNGLIRAGAAPVLAASDVLDVLGVRHPPSPAESDSEEGLLAAFPPGAAATADALAAFTGKPISEILEALLHLELAGRVAREGDGTYRRSRTVSRDES